MQLLVLGGTGWLGREVAARAVAAGHAVICLARSSTVPDGARGVRGDRDRADALAGLTATRWDAVIDVARRPGHVRRAVRELAPAADHYVFVSTVSVYASHAALGQDEDAERLAPLTSDDPSGPDDYGSAKVACEDAVLAGFGAERSLIVRPGLIGGPGDPTGRTDYWPWRFAHPAVAGTALVPDAPELPTSLIDVRDLADWLVRCAALGTPGIFNALGPAVSLVEHLATARSAAASSARPIVAPEAWLLERDVHEWAGPRSLPLWLSDRSWYGMSARSVDRARAAGLTSRPLVETLRDSLAWRSRQTDRADRGAGLSDADERQLLAELSA